MHRLAPMESVRILPFLHLTYVENTGAAWSLLKGGNSILIGISMALMAGLLWVRRRWPADAHWAHYGAMLVVAGALGNLYDRITLGCVVDFLELPYWPVFNIADSCICVGAAFLAWGLREKT
jgi:signal peptidase II